MTMPYPPLFDEQEKSPDLDHMAATSHVHAREHEATDPVAINPQTMPPIASEKSLPIPIPTSSCKPSKSCTATPFLPGGSSPESKSFNGFSLFPRRKPALTPPTTPASSESDSDEFQAATTCGTVRY